MDFTTRDRYRHVIEEIAKHSPLSEQDVAHKAMQLANQEFAGNAIKASDNERGRKLPCRLLPDPPRPFRTGEECRHELAAVDTSGANGRSLSTLFAYVFGVLLITCSSVTPFVTFCHWSLAWDARDICTLPACRRCRP